MKEKFKKDFTLMSILLLPLAVALNVVGGQLAVALALPIYVDSIGTILAGILGGPMVGLVAGILSGTINGIFNPNFFPFVFVGASVGLVSGLFAKKEMYNKLWKIVISVIGVTAVSILIGTPIAMYVFGGITGYVGAVLVAIGKSILESVLTSQLIVELADKSLSIAVACTIIRAMSPRILAKYPCGEQFIKVRSGDGTSSSVVVPPTKE